LDDIAFVGGGTPTPTLPPGVGPALSVDAATDRHPISPYVYGMNFASEDVAEAVQLPVRRWGGNSTTRYNWQIDVYNTGSDWYFENIPDDPGADDAFVEQNQDTGTETILTMPLLGWTPKRRVENHPYDCGFKVSAYGAQDSVDPWDTDCGNGRQSGVPITGNNPLDTSKVITESFVTAWVTDLVATHGTAANGGVMFYNLDNEPMLWDSTHRDVHPAGTTYDEVRDRTYQYAAAIKAADPTAQTLGPVTWGWCAYLYSGADGCSPGADRAAHGDVDFTPWYLAQMQAYESTYGVRILDYLDLHYYPQADDVALSSAGDAQTQALRLRSTRSLWDPTYMDESWISDTTDEPIQFIPRMKQWVADNYPGTKLAITEYNWGALDHINGALTQADVLGIFGREGLDLATLWGPPELGDPGTFAFRMYRNYDGSGGAFGETSVHASSADQGQLAIYAAQRSGDGALTLMIVNKTGQPLTSDVSLANFQPGANAQVYRYSSANLGTIVQEADQPVTPSGFSATFPANSITLIVIPPGGGPLTGVSIDGPDSGVIDVDYTFVAEVSPVDASTPVTYTWTPEPSSGQDTSTVVYNWDTLGTHTITVTAENDGGSATATHAITITNIPLTGVNIDGPEIGVISATYAFTASVSPANASLPITYTWSPPPLGGQGASVATYRWDTGGVKSITVGVQNGGDVFTADHIITILEKGIYLPLVVRD
ncbi:MAG: glycoside hydrolase family 44 protein, partial [Anaerolineae bacterium]